MTTAWEAAIETRDLTRQFDGVFAVQGLNLSVARGTFFGFLGPNGAGKSTTLKMLTGLLAPTSGFMRVLRLDPTDAQQGLQIKRKVGVVPGESALFDNLTAREYLTFVGRMHLLPREAIARRSDELLALMGLAGETRNLCMEFSHGMQKKLAMAAALMPAPEVLVALFFVLTAWTYCLRGWLVNLMVNKRRRRAIVMGLTAGLVLLGQLPNLLFNSPAGRQFFATTIAGILACSRGLPRWRSGSWRCRRRG